MVGLPRLRNPISKLRPPALAPLALAAFPLLTVYAGNLREISPGELLAALGLFLGGTLLLNYLLRRLDSSQERADLTTLWLVATTFSFALGEMLLAALPARWQAFVPPTTLAAAWLLLAPLGAWGLRAGGFDLAKLRRAADLFSASLFVVAVVLLGMAIHLSPWLWSLPTAENPRAALAPHEEIVLTAPANPPDIYYLVFDRYADAETLAARFNHNNRPFLEALRARGFTVAEQSRANYPKTELSMASALNLAMHEETVWPKFRYSQLLRRHRVGELLTGIGYRYHHFGNLHDGLRSSEFAAENYRFSAMESELGENLLRLTPLGPLTAPHSLREQELKKFAGVAAAAQNGRPEPKFVYAHFMLPHEPWKFDEQGHEPSELDIAQRGETNCYVRQLRFTNARILELIDSIRAGSARPPIIVLQADEGPELRYEHDAALSAEQKIRKRCGILSAFLLPERDGAKLVSPGITPVNTFRLIFREYFAADLPPLADRSYYFEPANPWGKPDLTQPCRFVDVTEIVRSP